MKNERMVRHIWLEWITSKAEKNLGKWGVQDFETLGLAVAEEAGELAQAILQNKHEGGERVRITAEALDLAALCVQVLVTMSERHGAENVLNALCEDAAGMKTARGRCPVCLEVIEPVPVKHGTRAMTRCPSCSTMVEASVLP